MRISDWSSDVCSSDLTYGDHASPLHRCRTPGWNQAILQGMRPCPACYTSAGEAFEAPELMFNTREWFRYVECSSCGCFYIAEEIGRASCRERVCKYV